MQTSRPDQNPVSPIRLAIAVPTYNEAKNISKLILGVKQAVADVPTTVLIIDDSSPDGTGTIAKEIAQKEQTKTFKIEVLPRPSKEGLGKAYADGLAQLLKGDFTHILQMDADLSHNPSYITHFIDAAKEFDFIVGSRYINGGATPPKFFDVGSAKHFP